MFDLGEYDGMIDFVTDGNCFGESNAMSGAIKTIKRSRKGFIL